MDIFLHFLFQSSQMYVVFMMIYSFIAGWSGENKHVEGINMIYFDDR